MDDPSVRAADRVGQRLGDLPRRHHRDGVAGGDRRASTRSCSSAGLAARSQLLADRRRGRVDRCDDMDLLPRHRAVGADPDVPAEPRDLHLALFAVVALVKVYANSPAGSLHVSASWFNPFDLSWAALIDGVLLGIFIYWGWDSGVAVNEESRDRDRGPGQGGRRLDRSCSLIYVVVSAAAQAYHGTGFLAEQLRRRAQRARQGRARLRARQAADHRRAHVGLRVDADDDPADRADDAVDGEVGRDPGGVRPRPPALLDADVLDAADGRAVDRVDGRAPRGSTPTRTCSATRSPRSASRSASTTASPGSPARCTSAASSAAAPRSCPSRILPLLGGLLMGAVFVKAFLDYRLAGAGYAAPLLGIQVPIAIGIGVASPSAFP